MADQSSRNTTPGRGRTYTDGYGIVEPVADYRPWDVDPEFQALYGRLPVSLDDLVVRDILEELPQTPDGKDFVLDRQSGEVLSPSGLMPLR